MRRRLIPEYRRIVRPKYGLPADLDADAEQGVERFDGSVGIGAVLGVADVVEKTADGVGDSLVGQTQAIATDAVAGAWPRAVADGREPRCHYITVKHKNTFQP